RRPERRQSKECKGTIYRASGIPWASPKAITTAPFLSSALMLQPFPGEFNPNDGSVCTLCIFLSAKAIGHIRIGGTKEAP
ncbi:MAG TPA: hypothetical protein VK210_16075, partial [Terriglobia bacterium]|nr:hypothetical protein [Terriglobia bacterium]